MIRLFWRGFLIVSLTATNVGQVAGGHYLGALIIGFLISFVWWTNSHGAAHSTVKYGREAYACGAATGTVFGMFMTKVLYG